MAQNNIHSAICAVMGEVSRLKKADKNKFASYDFTSTDDFKDAMRPLLAKHGLAVHMTQSGFEFREMTGDKDKRILVAQFSFDVTLCHTSGERDLPEHMTVALAYTGAQTSGAARSYAIKEWLKSRFLASSGDIQEEADMRDQEREGMRLSRADARAMYSELQQGLRDAAAGRDHEAVAEWWSRERDRLSTLPKDWFLGIKKEYADTWTVLKAQADLDRMSNAKLDELAMENDGEI